MHSWLHNYQLRLAKNGVHLRFHSCKANLYLAIFTFIFASFLYSSTQSAQSCTVVFWNTNQLANVVARSMDLYASDEPKIVVNPRGISRTGLAGDQSLSWKSRYGNVVVTAFNTPTVSDGMNEHGLAVHLLYLSATEYSVADAQLPTLSNTMWAQYLLDNYKTVSEVLANLDKFAIVPIKVHEKYWPIHLAMQDASGDSAIIEYTRGKRKIYHGTQFQIATNEPAYNLQLKHLKKYKTFGGNLPLPGDTNPLARFVRVATYLKTLPPPETNIDAVARLLSVMRTAMIPFGALDTSQHKIETTWPTRWVTIADLKNKVFYFNSTTAPNLVWLEFKNLNFSELSPVLTIDPNKLNLVGEISKDLVKA